MSLHLSRLASAASALFFGAACAAQEPALISPEDLRSDFSTLYTVMQEAHYDIDAATPMHVLDQRYSEILSELNEPLSQADAAIRFQTFLAEIRHGHARIDFPVSAWSAWRDTGGGAIPVDIRIRDGRVWISDYQAGFNRLQRGDEILALNGEPNAIWLSRLTRHLSAETPDMAYSLLESYLPVLYWVEYPGLESVTLRVRHQDGSESELILPLVSRSQMSDLPERETDSFTLPEFDARLLEGDIAYLRPGPFYNAEPGASPFDPTRYIARVDAAFGTFMEADARALIIDIRDNPGGDNSFSDSIIAWFAEERWTIASDFRIRVSDATTASNQARLDALGENAGGVSAIYAELFAETATGETVSFDLPYAQPREGERFEGPVYLLVNRYSYSNAVNMAAIMQDYGFGIVAGETTTDMATTYGALENFTLPASGIRVGYPKAHIIRPSGVEHSHPVTPDLPLPFPVLRGREDVVLETLRNRILEDLG